MASFVEDADVNGRYVLPFEFAGISGVEFTDKMVAAEIVGFSVPRKQSLRETWSFYLHNAAGLLFQFSALTTGIGGWQEMGSLKIVVSKAMASDESQLDSEIYEYHRILPFQVSVIQAMVFEDESVYAECGILLAASDDRVIQIVCAPAPGSVSARISAIESEFLPELGLSDYALVPFPTDLPTKP